MKGFLLIDESNILFAASSTTQLSVGDQPTQGVFGFVRRLRDLVSQYPQLTPIVLSDGLSWRYKVFPEYKAMRQVVAATPAEKAQAEIRKSVQSQKALTREACDLLGVRRMMANNYEADDLAAMLVKRYGADRTVLLISGDKDWIQLVRPNVAWWDVIHDRRLTYQKFASNNEVTRSVGIGFEKNGQWIGLSRPEQWADVKCLMGDKSDEIGGVGGIGEKGAVELVAKWGSVANFMNAVIDKSVDLEKLPKKLRDFASSDEKMLIFHRNKILMDLESSQIPKPYDLMLTKPTFNHEGFQEFCQDWMFQSILTSFNKWVEPFKDSVNAAAA